VRPESCHAFPDEAADPHARNRLPASRRYCQRGRSPGSGGTSRPRPSARSKVGAGTHHCGLGCRLGSQLGTKASGKPRPCRLIIRSGAMKTLRNPQDREQILARLQRVRPGSSRCWGKMSAHQMICHLTDGFRLYMGLMNVAAPGFPYPSKLLKWVCLWVPIRWPKGFHTVPELDQRIGGTQPVEFESDVAELRTLLHRFSRNPGEFNGPHPCLARMSPAEWMRLGYLHCDHHLRQFGV